MLPATPHCVKIEGVPKDIYRLNHVAFFEPQYNEKIRIPSGEKFEEIIEKDPLKFYYRTTNKFKSDMNYKDYTDLLSSSMIKNEMNFKIHT